MRLAMCIGLWIGACFVIVHAVDFPEREPNNTFPPGSPLGTLLSGDRIVGTIAPVGDVDYHTFYTAGTGQPGWYRFVFRTEGIPSGGDPRLELFDGLSPEYTLCFNDDFVLFEDLNSQCGFDMYWNGNTILWGLLIEAVWVPSVWPYAIRVTYSPIQVLQGPTIPEGEVVLDTAGPGTLVDTVLSLFGSQGSFIAYDDDSGPGFRSSLVRNLLAGTYYVAVSTGESFLPIQGQARMGLGLGTMDEGTYTLTIGGFPFAGTISRGTAAWYRVTVTPKKRVSGRVLMQQFIGDPRMWPVTFQLREPGTTNVLETHVVPLDIEGFYSFDTTLTGTVDVAAKSAQWLRAVRSLDLGGNTSGFDWFLIGGDANGDNAVDLNDLSMALVNFARTGPYSRGDVNGDSQVDLADISLVLLNIGKRGAP